MNDKLTEVLGDQKQGIILAGYMGSISHGTNLHKNDPHHIDDKDVMCIKIHPLGNYFGMGHKEHFRIQGSEWDIVGYDIIKYFRLLLKSNPNVIGLLWLRPEHYLHISPLGQRIIDNRNLFASKQAYKSFAGYANGQLHKMTSFQKYEGYMGAKRKALVDKYGYDCKNACHLIRLLNMAYEFLATGELNVFREHDNQILIEIKTGQWVLEKVQLEAERMFGMVRLALKDSPLPNEPDREVAQALLIDIMSEYFYLNRKRQQ